MSFKILSQYAGRHTKTLAPSLLSYSHRQTMSRACFHNHTSRTENSFRGGVCSGATPGSTNFSNYLSRLPLVLVLGIATAVTAVHRLLPHAVSSLLCMEKFQAQPSSEYLSHVIDRVRSKSIEFQLYNNFFFSSNGRSVPVKLVCCCCSGTLGRNAREECVICTGKGHSTHTSCSLRQHRCFHDHQDVTGLKTNRTSQDAQVFLFFAPRVFLMQIILTPDIPFKLGPRAFSVLLDIFLYHNFSVLEFVRGLDVRDVLICLILIFLMSNLSSYSTFGGSIVAQRVHLVFPCDFSVCNDGSFHEWGDQFAVSASEGCTESPEDIQSRPNRKLTQIA